jgi:hypothetical protein
MMQDELTSQSRSTSEVSLYALHLEHPLTKADDTECIVYTWDYHSSLSVWNGLRTQPILADEVQTFKALIVVHKLLQEGHPVVGPWCHYTNTTLAPGYPYYDIRRGMG